MRALIGLLCLPLMAESPAAVDRALERLYNFDFPSAHRVLSAQIAQVPGDHLAHATRAAAYLFHELDRLAILEISFFSDDSRIKETRKLKADPEIRNRFFESINEAQRLAQERLAKDASDKDALMTMAITFGMWTDYAALVEKKQLSSLGLAGKSNHYGQKLLRLDPSYEDAYLARGITEYLIGSLPFFVRWFVRIEAVSGDKKQAIADLQRVAKNGRLYGPFARILLSVIYLREKKLSESQRVLAELARDFPENPLIRKELAKVTDLMRNGGASKASVY